MNVAHLTIHSENGSANCIVNASNSGDHVFNVTADYVNISGFTVENATGSWKAGIYLGAGVDLCNVSDNNVSNNDYGIYLRSSSNNTLTSNTANSNNHSGIFLYESSNNNTLTSNTVSDNGYGIFLYWSSNNTLTSNTANSNNYHGIWLRSSSNNALTSNNASGNTLQDFYSDPDSHNNTIEDLTIASYPTTVSFIYDQGIGLKGVQLQKNQTPLER